VEIWKGVTMSCLLPFIFSGYVHDNGCTYYDGGLSNSLPFEMFPADRTLASYIKKEVNSGDEHSFLGVFTRVIDAFETSTQLKIKNANPSLNTIINLNLKIQASERIFSTGRLRIDVIEKDNLIKLGEMFALEKIRPDLFKFVKSFEKIWFYNKK
jgi:predicted patatin/cPLA2 family phospholipase